MKLSPNNSCSNHVMERIFLATLSSQHQNASRLASLSCSWPAGVNCQDDQWPRRPRRTTKRAGGRRGQGEEEHRREELLTSDNNRQVASSRLTLALSSFWSSTLWCRDPDDPRPYHAFKLKYFFQAVSSTWKEKLNFMFESGQFHISLWHHILIRFCKFHGHMFEKW